MTQNPKTFEIDLTQRGFFDDVAPIPVDKRRRMKPDDPLTDKEVTQLRSLIGKLAWPARETMPQIAFDVSEAQQKMADRCVRRLTEVNALLRKAKKVEKEQGVIRIPRIDLDRRCMVAFSDASFDNMPRHGSQGGYMILVAERACGAAC